MLIDPHPIQQHAGLQYEVIRPQLLTAKNGVSKSLISWLMITVWSQAKCLENKLSMLAGALV